MRTIKVYNNKISYSLYIRRKFTFIRGDSATGKTTLINLINDAVNKNSATLVCDMRCQVLIESLWEVQLKSFTDTIFFIDEGFRVYKDKNFIRTILNSNNCFVFINRDDNHLIPYSVREIYEFKTSGKYIYQVQKYTSATIGNSKLRNPDYIITEDSNSGMEFFECFSRGRSIVESSNGNSNITNTLRILPSGSSKYVFVDGAAYGSYIAATHELIKYTNKVCIHCGESFEFILLNNPVFRARFELPALIGMELSNLLPLYSVSWEVYFTEMLIGLTQCSNMQYTKSRLNDFYKSDNFIQSTIRVFPELNFYDDSVIATTRPTKTSLFSK